MKKYKANLLGSNPSAVYNKDQTYLAGSAALKTLQAPYNTSQVIGAPLTKFIDVYTDTAPVGAFLPGMMHATDNGRIFILQSTPATGAANIIAMYTFNYSTGAYSYVGKIAFAITAPATLTVTGFKVDDRTSSNIKVFVTYRSTTAQIGGVMMINKIQVANFVPSGFPTFYAAQSDDVAGVYSLLLSKEVGGANLMTTAAAVTLPGLSSSDPKLANKCLVHNGISATHQYYIFDYTAAPTMASLGTSTVTAVNTTGASTTFTMAGNTLAVNDMVIIKSGAPTAYTNSTPTSAQTVYYVVATNFVAGSTFSLSATLGGAILAATGTSTTTVFARANGQSINLAVGKTANLPTLGGGTLLLTNSENFCVPSQGSLSGQDCLFMATTTNFHLGKPSELWYTNNGTSAIGSPIITGLASTSGYTVGMSVVGNGIPLGALILSVDSASQVTLTANATTAGAQDLVFGASLWPSLNTINVVGTGIDYVVPVPTHAYYGTSLDKVGFLVAGSVFMLKNWVNSVEFGNCGNTGNAYLEAQNHVTDPLQLSAIGQLENAQGWIFAASSATTGQRGIIAMNVRADYGFDYSYIVSPVLSTPGKPKLKAISTIEMLYDYTAANVFYYRTSANKTDAVFNSPTGGWTMISTATDLDIELSDFTQFKLSASMIAAPNSANVSVTTPPQIIDVAYTTQPVAEVSDHWEYSNHDSSENIPTRAGFVLRGAYASGTVPKLYFRAWDADSNTITQANTTDNAGNFEYSTDSGVTWLPLGTIPNTVGTRIRYTWTTPPGVESRVAIQES